MFKKLIEEISQNVKNKIEDGVYNFISGIILYSFCNSHALSKNYDRYWGNEKRDIIRKAITEAFNENMSNQISKEVNRSTAQYFAKFNEEEFIDKIVERINRKQVGK